MTREEAIKILVRAQRGLIATALSEYEHKMIEALEMALSALRGPTREQVEKVWRGEWIGIPNMGVYDIACSKCGYSTGIRFWSSDFCPNCGAPMTDEAVDMVMERLEALRDE